jgi:hypothetical protein
LQRKVGIRGSEERRMMMWVMEGSERTAEWPEIGMEKRDWENMLVVWWLVMGMVGCVGYSTCEYDEGNSDDGYRGFKM